MEKRHEATRRISDAALTLLFLVIIFLPLLSKIIPIDPGVRLQEKRMLASRPKLTLSPEGLLRYPGEFDRFIKDHFGFRSSLVHLFSRIRSRIPGLIVGNNVLVGKDGWYFITQNMTMEDYRGIIKLSSEQLNTIKDTLQNRKEWLAMFGIKYLLVVAPAKWEIYPEKVPGHLKRASEHGVLDQIISFLQAHADIDLLDLRRPLRELKVTHPVYHLVDTHWNNIGLFASVQEIKKRLSGWFPGIASESLDNYRIEETRDFSGDLASMMGLQRNIPRIDYTLVGRNGERFAPAGPIEGNPLGRTLVFDDTSSTTQGVKTVVFHDSFGRSFHRYLKDSFIRSVYSWRRMPDTGLIIREKPDVVIQELGQRNISNALWQNPAGIAGPNTAFAGKRAKFLSPNTYHLAGFKAHAQRRLPVRQYLSLRHNGKEIFEWLLTEKEMTCSVPPHAGLPEKNFSEYSFFYRYEPFRGRRDKERNILPFDMRVICRETGSFTGINGSVLPFSKGYNVYLINPNGHFSQTQAFDYGGSELESARLAQHLRKLSSRKGFLLLACSHRPGRGLTPEAKRAFRALGLGEFPKNQQQWHHVALVDLGSKRVIAERSGADPQRLFLGSYRLDAGFRIHALRLVRDPD